MLSRISVGGLCLDKLPSTEITFTYTNHRLLGITECLVLMSDEKCSLEVISEVGIWEEYYV